MLDVQEGGGAGTIKNTLVPLIPQALSPQAHKTVKTLPSSLVYLLALRNNALEAGGG